MVRKLERTKTGDDIEDKVTNGFLSIDISKERLDAAYSIGTSEKALTATNDNEGFEKLQKAVMSAGPRRLYVSMEATGSYWMNLALFFHRHDATIFVVNPARIKAQRVTEQRRSKTDKIDASVILRFTKEKLFELHRWTPPCPAVIELQQLVRYRELLVADRAKRKTVLKSKDVGKHVNELVLNEIERLGENICALESTIRQVIAANATLKKQMESASSVKGVGFVTSSTLLSECRAFGEIVRPRQVVAFAGLDIVEESSGTMRKPPRISKQGSALLRKAFFMAALSAVRGEGMFKTFYDRLTSRGMKKKPALVAVSRKLLEVTAAVVLSNGTFNEHHQRVTSARGDNDIVV